MSNDFEALKADATTGYREVEVCLDLALLGEFEAAFNELASQRKTTVGMLREPAAVRALAERVVELDQAVREKTKVYQFKKLPLNEWKALQESYPADEEMQTKLRQQLAEAREINPQAYLDTTTDWERFSIAAVSKCAIWPEMDLDQVQWLRNHVPPEKWTEIWDACHSVNTEGSRIPKYASGIVEKMALGLNSITAENGESLSPSSEGA
ncbi:hypothetical protein G1H11_14130 [Phytoactinopolyspora alkaliphila]|uniref:Uncharacterized protein n=1 Tax=Phytoactinopolyspora alkaliphila TaxID=1783498 RepID=A0A6N9YN88_9ACTN|nr:hypothetical protein [Phytoactinopolyspora alkaliphila]NED96444.1 hypothetical protein [Phytoactinopolyspora alkaliphila]